MSEIKVITGNEAVAYGVKLSRVKFIAAYPITPQTTIVEKISKMVESGELDAEFLRVESEHSALAATLGASTAGLRSFTATSSHGLSYMNEMVIWTAGARHPVVMAVVCRAFGPPWNIWNEHTDILMQRDTGWIIMFAENNQEVLDTVIQAYKIAENERVLLPVIIGLDAFILSHTSMPVEIPDQDIIDKFLPSTAKKPFILDPNNPITHGSLTYPDSYMEFRYLIHKSMEEAKNVIEDVDTEWEKLTGRSYGGLIDSYKCEDAEVAIITVGSSAGDAKEAVDRLRDEGYRVGVIRLRVFRPFPTEKLRELALRLKAIGVVDRNLSPGIGGIIQAEVKASLYDLPKKPLVQGFIAGLGGRDITVRDFIEMYLNLYNIVEKGITPQIQWIGLRKEVVR